MNVQETEGILLKYEDKISELGFALRDFLIKELKGIIETPDIKANIIGYGYGPGYIDSICVIIPSKKRIKLGFNRGAELPDSEKILTGTGKVHKYAEIKSIEDIKSKALKNLLKEGVKAYKKRMKDKEKKVKSKKK